MVAETRRSVPRAVRSGRVLWVLPPLMALWANLHGGFIFGLALIGIFAAGETCEAWWSAGSGDGSYRAMAMRLWRILAVSVAACLLNPNGLKGLIYPFTYLGNNASTRYIAEWVSPNFHEVQYQYFEALLLALIVGALLSTWRVGAAASSRGVIAARRFTEAGLILAFTHLALDSVRNINLFAVIVAPLIAVYLTSAWRNVRAYRAAGAARASRHRPRRRTETRFTPTPAKAAVNIILAGVIAVAVLVVSAPSLTYAHNAAVQARRFPSGAVAYLRAHRPAGPVLNSYDWGGYLIWALYPRLRVYVDGRPDMYGDRFMDSFIRTWQAQPGWQDTLRRQGVRLVLVEPTSGLARALATTHGWRVAYHDAVAVLYERVARD